MKRALADANARELTVLPAKTAAEVRAPKRGAMVKVSAAAAPSGDWCPQFCTKVHAHNR